jgi:carbon storage regulator
MFTFGVEFATYMMCTPFRAIQQEDGPMLVLSRKSRDTVVIDQRIVVTILEIRGDRIRLGIEAPDDVAILRGELQWHPRDNSGHRVPDPGKIFQS